MPGPIFRAYTTMLPRLRAEELLEKFNNDMAGSGMGMNEKGRAEYTQGLESAMTGVSRPKRATATTLASMGIVARTEPGPGKKPDG